jgi:hypothetical protein
MCKAEWGLQGMQELQLQQLLSMGRSQAPSLLVVSGLQLLGWSAEDLQYWSSIVSQHQGFIAVWQCQLYADVGLLRCVALITKLLRCQPATTEE